MRHFLLLLLFASAAWQTLPAVRPNVLFISVDDMNDWINCLGGYAGKVHTPNLDRLAARGTLFTNAHCASPKCAPSRTALMTGLMPSSTGLYDNGHWWYPNMPEAVTLPMHFRNQGYKTVGAGKIHHHTAGSNPPHQWDEFQPLVFRDDPWFRTDKRNYPWSESGPNPPDFPFGGVKKLGHENDWGSLPLAEEALDDVRTVDAALAHLKAESDKPFFIACGLFRPHLPWYVPQAYFDMYKLDEIVLPAVFTADLDDLPKPASKLAADRRQDFEQIKKAGKWREAVRAYLACISFADAQIGRLLNALDEGPHAADTIIVLWSDHGWHLGEKQHWHKSTLWERATRVPLIISAPGFSPGRCARPVNLIDLYPTLSELCQLPVVDGLDGISLAPLLRNPESVRERPSVTEFLEGNAAVRDERYRYIRYHDGSEELYDHQTDPHEWHNRADDPEMAAIKAGLLKWLPQSWAAAAPGKKAFVFDPVSHSWTEKASGRVFNPTDHKP
ncbi:sulfatase [Prosthecobacter sp. SYSU 5D2]|uniref:sulfatase n=1 Tax=Prosthecobacter sp. SYSU 5D2 TaxID=3134134 RepID=UPI0031FE60AC